MRKPAFKTICIAGMGLIGGSIGIAIRKKKLAKSILGLARREESIKKALEKGAIDEGTTRLKEKRDDIGFVIIAVPVGTIPEMVKNMLPYLKSGCVITDVGSTKKNIVETIDSFLPPGFNFIGSHPLAGSEKSGIDWATDILFKNATCVITPGKRSSRESRKLVKSFWEALGMQVIEMTPDEHDMLLAMASHLPHLAAAGLVNLVDDFRTEDSRTLLAVATGFRDTTRIAASSPAIWTDIFMTNKKKVLFVLRKYIQILKKVENSISREQVPNLIKFLEKAKKLRDALNKS